MSHVLVDQYGKPLVIEQPPKRKPDANSRPMAKYDAAQTTNENKNHWLGADGLSAAQSNNELVRSILRRRARYECGNNGYAKGLVRGRANDTIGVCPRLQLSLPETYTDPDFQANLTTNPDAARAIEVMWSDWCDTVGLADKLRLLDKSETRDGEAFAIQVTNPRLTEGPQLDIKLIEADQCTTPDIDYSDPLAVDGIVFDEHGNPAEYHFLKQHPGDSRWAANWVTEYQRFPAERVHHLYDPERIGEVRGIPGITPALPLFNQMREFTLAALGSAKLAAMIAGVIETESGNVDPSDNPPEIESMDEIPFARNALLTMPPGATAKAFDSKQPGPSYKEFKSEINTEAGRSIDAPKNQSTGSSAEYNFSSGKLDRIPYEQAIKIRRDRIRRVLLDRLFKAWAAEALMIPNYLPIGLPPLREWRAKWRWDGFASIDPVKDANASQTRMQSGVSTMERECAERGDDWEEVLEQQAREKRKRERLGLPDPSAVAMGQPQVQPTPQEDPANA
jgi:lambda family phage portal protein